MGQEADTPLQAEPVRPRRRWLWTSLAWVLIAAAIGGYVELTRRSRAAHAGETARFVAVPRQLKAKLDAMGAATVGQVQTLLGQEIRPEPISGGRRRGSSYVRVDLPSGHRVTLLFDFSDRLYQSSVSTLPGRAPQPPRLLRILEAAHPVILTWMLPAWAVLLTLVAVARPIRQMAAQAALALALLSLAAAVLHHGRIGRYIGLADHFVFVPLYATQAGLTAASIIVVALTLIRRRDPNDLRCPRCRYDLHSNESGVCPECGLRIPPWLRWKVRTLSGKPSMAVAVVAEGPFIITDDSAEETAADPPPH